MKNKRFIQTIPFIILLGNFIYSVIIYNYCSENISMVLGQIFSFSLLTNIERTYYVFKFKFCLYSKIANVGLHLLILLNLIYYSTNLIDDYYFNLYDKIICSIFLFFSVLFMSSNLNKRFNKNYDN